MAAMRSLFGERAKQSFSYLYVANVLGATAGTIGSALVLLELFGFCGTLLAGGPLKRPLAGSALAWSFRSPPTPPRAPAWGGRGPAGPLPGGRGAGRCSASPSGAG